MDCSFVFFVGVKPDESNVNSRNSSYLCTYEVVLDTNMRCDNPMISMEIIMKPGGVMGLRVGDAY